MKLHEIYEGTRCWKGYKKKGMKTMFGKRVPNCVKNEDQDNVAKLKPHTKGTKYPLFSKKNIQKAYTEWATGARIDRDIEIVGNDKELYVIRQMYDGDGQHFEDGEWYLTDANNKIVDNEGYPDPGELLYDHSADEVFYPKDPDEIDENLNERINMGNQEFDFRIFDEIEPGDKFTVFDAEGNYVDVTLVKHSNQKNANAWSHNVNDIEIKLPDGKIKRLNNSTFAITSNTRHRDYKIQGIGSFMNKEYRNTPLSSIDPGIKISLRSAARQQAKKLLGGKVLNDAGNKIQAVRYISDYHALTYDLEMRHQKKFSENFADGKKKGKSRPGRVKRSGASCKGSVTSLRKKAKNSSGEKAKMYHWCANMKSGRKKK